MDCQVRLLDISIENLKNIGNGYIRFDSYDKVLKGDFSFDESDVIGVYGANGSSKSTLIDAFSIVKKLFINEPLSNELYDYISLSSNSAKISISIYCCVKNVRYIIKYSFEIGKIEENEIKIFNESIDYWCYNFIWSKQKSLFMIDNQVDDENFVFPKQNLTLLVRKKQNVLFDLYFLKGKKESANLSFLLSNEFKSLLFNYEEFNIFSEIINKLNIYFKYSFHLFDNVKMSDIASKKLIPFFYKEEVDGQINCLYGTLSLYENTYVKEKYLRNIKESIANINIVLSKLIDGMEIEFEELGRLRDEKGELCVNYNILSKKKGYSIPLRFESDGIKKIVSILFSLVDAFNNSYAMLIIDELDSGIYEFLLGLILDIFKEKGQGQLLFTSHNLRALEVLKDNIIFTTNDETHRFSKIKYLKPSNNLRSVYLRNLYLRNDDEFNINIDEYEIYRALMEAGDMINYEEEE